MLVLLHGWLALQAITNCSLRSGAAASYSMAEVVSGEGERPRARPSRPEVGMGSASGLGEGATAGQVKPASAELLLLLLPRREGLLAALGATGIAMALDLGVAAAAFLVAEASVAAFLCWGLPGALPLGRACLCEALPAVLTLVSLMARVGWGRFEC